MIRHIVMFKLKPEMMPGALNQLKKMLDKLPGLIPEVKYFETGVNISESPSAYDLVLVSDFEDELHLEEYKKHPSHLEVAEYIQKVKDEVTVVDYKA